MIKKAIIFGIKGYQLTKKEKKLFRKTQPWGIILFSRNIKDIYQLKILINNIQKIHKDKKYPILIDQEGGKVSRLNKILNLELFSQNFFGRLYKKDKNLFNAHKKTKTMFLKVSSKPKWSEISKKIETLLRKI